MALFIIRNKTLSNLYIQTDEISFIFVFICIVKYQKSNNFVGIKKFTLFLLNILENGLFLFQQKKNRWNLILL